MTSALSSLLRGQPHDLQDWIAHPNSRRLRLCVLTIILTCGAYGVTVGIWRAPLMGVYVGIKMPALLFITLTCNGLLNGILGQLLGSGLGFRQSLMAQLMSFAIAALVLGALAPVTFFMALNAPGPTDPGADAAHASFLVLHSLLIAIAGIIANLHLAKLLVAVAPDSRTAGLTLLAWLAGNAFVGAQFSWIMRPFFGTPTIEFAFLRPHPFDGTFYEVFWKSLQDSTGGNGIIALLILAILLIALHLPVWKLLNAKI